MLYAYLRIIILLCTHLSGVCVMKVHMFERQIPACVLKTDQSLVVFIYVTERLTGWYLRFPIIGTGPLACLSLFPIAGCG